MEIKNICSMPLLVSCLVQSSGIHFYASKKNTDISTIQQTIYIILPEKNSVHSINNLLLSLHVLTNSDSLFNNWLLSKDLIINGFSVKRNLQQSDYCCDFPWNLFFSKISRGVMFKSLNCQM